MNCSTIKSYRQGDINAPKPVHPTAVRNHGLFGIPFVRQHMIVDERWAPTSLTEEFKGMGDLLNKRRIFKTLEARALRKHYVSNNRCLKHQCRDGRAKLQMILHGDNTKQIRNFLINHKDMQRLYQKMPVHLVVDNINQRTFVMRKERDRLSFRLDQLKDTYDKKLMERAVLENRIKYENEFVLEEEIKSHDFRKKIENSHVRLKAIKTIHGTYKKMIQVLRHDAIFYEPILRSLSKDTEDQAAFIKHILYIGTPAICKFKELSEEYRVMEEKSRKNTQAKLTFVANYKKGVEISRTSQIPAKTKHDEAPAVHSLKRYVRETETMMELKTQVENIETTIKQVKFATLCSQAKEIYPRIKSQVDNNERLRKAIENEILGHDMLEAKMKRAEVFEGVLVNNLSEEELNRLERIQDLKDLIEKEEEYKAETLAKLKSDAESYVILRYTLWNLNEILHYVDRPPRFVTPAYPNSYLKLPLLKFEMLTMRACPPEWYEEKMDVICHLLKRKVQCLMKAYKKMNPEMEKEYLFKYNNLFIETMEKDEGDEAQQEKKLEEDEEDLLQDAKMLHNVPNRKQIKQQSAKIVEELSKREEV